MTNVAASPPTTSDQLHHGLCTPIDTGLAEQIWAWAAAGASPPDAEFGELNWLHATFDDGLAWGRRDEERWSTATAFGSLVPELRRETLWELRLFGDTTEILLWPVDDSAGIAGPLQGRVLTDTQEAPPLTVTTASGTEPPSPITSPIDRPRLLFGDRLIEHGANGNGFTLVSDITGARQVLPLDLAPGDFNNGRWWPARVVIRNYLVTDAATNSLRIEATRMAKVEYTSPPEDRP